MPSQAHLTPSLHKTISIMLLLLYILCALPFSSVPENQTSNNISNTSITQAISNNEWQVKTLLAPPSFSQTLQSLCQRSSEAITSSLLSFVVDKELIGTLVFIWLLIAPPFINLRIKTTQSNLVIPKQRIHLVHCKFSE